MKITSIQQQIRQQNRFSIYVDGEYSFSLGESALLESGITRGQELTSQELTALRQLSENDKNFGLVLRYAAMRSRSEWEMQQYMQRKNIPEPMIAKHMERLRRAHLLDDEAFARNWVENRRTLKTTSRSRLELELRQKHVADSIIRDVLTEDGDETDEIAIIRLVIDKKRRRYPDQQKLIAYLARQGYRYDDIKTALSADSD